ncbi:MAG: T9SS type A sorting domain-containing protein [Sphingobacteriia bacterium]|nr:T9SS type A sorting domain-containing protein [Sphingobacteriia bacterium]
MKKFILFSTTTLVFTLLVCSSFAQTKETIFFEDFESGWGNWWADNGVWDVGVPTVGPDPTHSPSSCAGTNLEGNYPSNANTRLISPVISLPGLNEDEKLQLKFWHWFYIQNADDQGVIQISVNSGTWQTISTTEIDGTSKLWTQYVADLSSYADSTIRFSFYFTSDGSYNYEGWYIDDVSIEKGVVIYPNPEDFEFGIGNWCADNGLWQVGIPTVGPTGTHSGQNCAGTNLNGDYPSHANTRLISPEVIINPEPGETPWLFFYHWFVIQTNNDQGFLQISVNHGDWQTVSNPFTGTNQSWSQYGMDLSDYAYSSVRFAFYFTSGGLSNYEGWYIDDIRIEGVVNVGIAELNYEMATTHPNPFTNKATIKFPNPSHSAYNLSIFNTSGNKVFEMQNVRTDQIKFERGNLPGGIYLFKLKGENIYSGKMIIE